MSLFSALFGGTRRTSTQRRAEETRKRREQARVLRQIDKRLAAASRRRRAEAREAKRQAAEDEKRRRREERQAERAAKAAAKAAEQERRTRAYRVNRPVEWEPWGPWRRNPLGGNAVADSSMTLLLVGGAAAAGYYLWKKNQDQQPAIPVLNQAPAPTYGYTIPNNLLGAMQNAFTTRGPGTDRGRWIDAMNGIVPAGAGPWGYVYSQWLGVYNSTGGGWPNNSQVTTWLNDGIKNYG